MSKSPSTLIPAIHLDKDRKVPLHKQLYEAFRDSILNGQLGAGTQLPSTRDLARYLELSRNTVMTAFEQLLAEGFLTGKVGSGTFVTYELEAHGSPSALPGGVRKAPARARMPTARKKEFFLDSLGPFRASVPALDLFPWTTWFNLVSRCARRQTRAQLAYSGPLGLQSFRETIAAYLRTARNVRCEPDQILVVSGSQQALWLASKVLLEAGETVCMEEPGYPGAREAFTLNGLTLGPVPVDEEGLNIALASELFPHARMAYVTPSHQYPIGTTMSLRRRLDLLRWAAANDSWIIEDDYDSEYRYASRPISSLQGLAEQDRVIYVGTFSKVLFPSLRVGYVVVPLDLMDRFVAVRAASDIFAPPLFQLVLTEFINDGHFARHIRRMRATYAARRDELVHCLAEELGDYAVAGRADSGTYLALYPKKDLDDVQLCVEAAAEGIGATPLSTCYAKVPERSGLILGFGGTDVKEIRPAVLSLRKAFERAATMSTATHPAELVLP